MGKQPELKTKPKNPIERAALGFGMSSEPVKKKRLKTSILYQHPFKGLIPGDVAIAVERALLELGLSYEEITTRKPSMSGDVDEIPFIRHQTDFGIEIPFGSYAIEGLGEVEMSDYPYAYIPTLQVLGKLNNKTDAKAVWNTFIEKVRELASSNSIFKGKSVIIKEKNDLLVPKPLALDNDITLVFNPDLEQTLDTCIFWPLKNRALCHENDIRTRRGAVLEGHYGAGKSLILYEAAKVAKQSGWGVLHITASMVNVAIELANMLEPVCIVVEDIDSSTHGDRDRLNNFLNAISSVSTKTRGDYCIVVSTNFVDRIDPALLRPERIDAVIHITLPEADAIKRCVSVFAGKTPVTGTLDTFTVQAANTTPAIISEVVQRAKIDAVKSGTFTITEELLLFHLANMEKQRTLATPVFKTDTDGDRLAQTLHQVVNYGNR